MSDVRAKRGDEWRQPIMKNDSVGRLASMKNGAQRCTTSAKKLAEGHSTSLKKGAEVGKTSIKKGVSVDKKFMTNGAEGRSTTNKKGAEAGWRLREALKLERSHTSTKKGAEGRLTFTKKGSLGRSTSMPLGRSTSMQKGAEMRPTSKKVGADGRSTFKMKNPSCQFGVDVGNRLRTPKFTKTVGEKLFGIEKQGSCMKSSDTLLGKIRCVMKQFDDDDVPGMLDFVSGTDPSITVYSHVNRMERSLRLLREKSSPVEATSTAVKEAGRKASEEHKSSRGDIHDHNGDSSANFFASCSHSDTSLDSSMSSISITDIKPVGILRHSGRFHQSCSSMGLIGAPSHNSQTRFSADTEVIEVPMIPAEFFDDVYYDKNEIAQFRYEAFCEKIGVDHDYDGSSV